VELGGVVGKAVAVALNVPNDGWQRSNSLPAVKDGDLVAQGDEPFDHTGADELGPSNDQYFHAVPHTIPQARNALTLTDHPLSSMNTARVARSSVAVLPGMPRT
jgi:hypothetical protein